MLSVGRELHGELRAVAGLLRLSIRDIVTDACREWLRKRKREIEKAGSVFVADATKGSRR